MQRDSRASKPLGMRFFRSPGLRYGFDPVVGDAARMRDVKQALGDSGMELLEVLSYYLRAGDGPG